MTAVKRDEDNFRIADLFIQQYGHNYGLAGRSVNIRTSDSFALAHSERDYLFDKADKPCPERLLHTKLVTSFSDRTNSM